MSGPGEHLLYGTGDPALHARPVTFAKPCAGCGGTKGTVTYGYAMGHLVRDVWTCACGRIFYEWTWESSMAAAREALAAWEARGKPAAPAPAPTSPPPRRPKGQIGLFD